MADPRETPGRPARPPRVWLHADLDCFFAAAEVLDEPALAGLPLAVGGPATGRGVVASCSYAARARGVRSAMPMAEAVRRCPGLVVRPPRPERYRALSGAVFAVFARFSPDVRPLSLDEASLDLTGTERLHGPPREAGRALRAAVRAEVGLVVSVGVATTRHVAKLACDLGKPDGLLEAPADPVELRAWLAPLPIERLPGVGPATAPRLRALGLATLGDLAALDPDEVARRLGAGGLAWRALARGEPASREDAGGRGGGGRRSISHETTFARDLRDEAAIRRVVSNLADEVTARARREGLRGRTVQVKVRFDDFTTRTRARGLPEATAATDAVFAVAWDLVRAAVAQGGRPVRLLGVALQAPAAEVDGPRQRLLFDEDAVAPASPARAEGAGPRQDGPAASPRPAVDPAIDRIRARLGADAIRRARDL